MPFNDLPQADDNALRSEESVLFVRQHLSLKNGFIAREQTPDYGIDIIAELLSATDGATGKTFAIQIKSYIESKTITINGAKFISLDFKTSRLGYLCKKPPAYGIIVYYDSANNIGYYDFVEEIVRRATIERDGESWKENKDVAIHFPVTNKLNESSSKLIHDIFTRRFANSDLLTATHGAFYGIPCLSPVPGAQDSLNFMNPSESLKKFGGYLINHNQYWIAYSLFSSISVGEVLKSKDLLFFASLVYAQCGYYLDAKLFLSYSLEKYSDWDEQQSALLDITSYRISLAMGQYTLEDFSVSLKKVYTRLKDKQNATMIESQCLHLKFLLAIKKYGFIKDIISPIIEEIKAFIKGLDNLDIQPEAKLLLTLDCAYYLSEAAHFQFARDIMQSRIKEGLNMPFAIEVRRGMAENTAELIIQSYRMAIDVLNEAEENDLEATKAHSLFVICNNFFQLEFNSFILKIEIDAAQKEETRQLYIQNMRRIITAINLFYNNKLLEDAHNMLCLASETNMLFKKIFGENLPNYDEQIHSQKIEELENETGLVRKKSLMEMVAPFDNHEIVDMEGTAKKYIEMTDEQLERMSLTLAESMKLPQNRIANVQKDLFESRVFYKQRHCINLLLLQNNEHTMSPNTLYGIPPKWAINCIIKNYQTAETEDIGILLEKLRNGVCNKCGDKIPATV